MSPSLTIASKIPSRTGSWPNAVNSAGDKSASLVGVPFVSLRVPEAVIPHGSGEADLKVSL